MLKKVKEYQIDIFGNEIPLNMVKKIKECNKRYVNKEISFKKEYVKNGGVLNVDKTLFKSN